jgi:hypothetical protein
MRERIRNALERVVQSASREAAWLNTLSLLEYTGARKIGRTAAAHHPPLEVLQHWSDETRHAAAFKALAVQLGAGEPSAYLCAEAAKAYFADLDETLSAWVAERAGDAPVLNYLLVTAVIERRAMALYPLYRAISRTAAVREELSRILVEEQSHRVSIEERCVLLLIGAGAHLEHACAIEERLFERFWSALERELEGRFTPEAAARPG